MIRLRPKFQSTPQALTWFILAGTTVLVVAFTLILVANFVVAKNYYVLPRIGAALVVVLYVAITTLLYRRAKYRTVALLLIMLYTLLGTATLILWSINAPVGVLVLCFVIILSGVMLGARYIIPTTTSLIGLILLIQLSERFGFITPDYAEISQHSSLSDVATYGALFIVFAIVSWLSGRGMAQSLSRARAAEVALAVEKDSLALRLKEKTREVKAAQMEEMQQLYRFAELGQLGTVLLHDLANNLTTLTLDIDDIGKRRTGEAVERAKESIGYLEHMVAGVRKQLRESDTPVVFDALYTILETIGALGPRARRAGVILEYELVSKEPFYLKSDPIRFAHVLTILIANGIESYGTTTSREYSPSVVVSASVRKKKLTITVTDYGKGISLAARGSLFKPFTSSKPNGMGIGLFMAHEMVERHFKGTLTLDPERDYTRFIITLPGIRK